MAAKKNFLDFRLVICEYHSKGGNLSGMEDELRVLSAGGWQPQGGVAVVPGFSGLVLTQLMVKGI